MSKKTNKRQIILCICVILTLSALIAVFLFVYQLYNKKTNIALQTAATQGQLESDTPFLSLNGDFTEQKVSDSESALAAINEAADIIGIQNIDTELSIISEDTVLDITYYKFAQEYKGIPVYGRNLVVSADNSGNVISASGNFQSIHEIPTEPSLSGDEAIETAKEIFDNEATLKNEGLTIYSLNGISPQLAWKIYVSSDETIEYCFISADNADVIAELALVYTERVLCSGLDVDNETQEFYSEYENGEYSMIDTERDITIYDANNSTVRIDFRIMDSNGKLYYSNGTNFFDENHNIVYIDGENFSYIIKDKHGNIVGTNGESVAHLWTNNIFTDINLVTNDSTTWDNPKAVTLMSRLSIIYDFWQSEFKRTSYNGQFGATVAVYNDYLNTQTRNAFSFGRPNIPITILTFGTDNSLNLDSIAHEFTHSVERSISNMNYEGESGALKEAYSDIFGEIIEDWENDGEFNNNCDWIHVDRNIVSPAKSSPALPTTYKGNNWVDTNNTSKQNDLGGVHANSLVISHAAYLVV